MYARVFAIAVTLLSLSWAGCQKGHETSGEPGTAPSPQVSEGATPGAEGGGSEGHVTHVRPEAFRFDSNLANARVSASPPSDDSTYRQRFTFGEGGVPWTVGAGSGRSEIVGDALAIEAESAASFDSPGIDVQSSSVPSILIDAKVTGCSEFAFAWRSADGGFEKENEATVQVARSEGTVKYIIDARRIGGMSSQLGTVGQVRVSLPAGGRAEIRSLGLAKTLDLFAGKSYGVTDYELERRSWVHSMFARTPCSVAYDVDVMPNARLRTAVLSSASVRTTFRIFVKANGEPVVLDEQEASGKDSPSDIDLDLSKWSGQRVEVTFEATSERPGSVALWCTPRLVRPYPVNAAQRPINVVWYVIDCLRATSVGAYGYQRDTTPAIDAVARDGVRFEWCFSPGTWTIDSVASYFTGLTPNAHSMLRDHPKLPQSMRVLQEVLRESGYTTGMLTTNPYLDDFHGYVRGFDDAKRVRVRQPGTRRGATVEKYPPNVEIADFLSAHKDEPFYMYVHTIEPHGPYNPPIELKVFSQSDGTVLESDSYDNCVAWADQNLAYIVGHLKREGLWDNTLLIITADHGQAFPEFDDGQFGHGEGPILSRVRIPLIMHLPGVLPQGAVINENVQSLDIPRTLFDLLRITPDPQFEGSSLLGLIDGSKKADFAGRLVFPTGQLAKWQAVVDGSWYFHDNDGVGELLDLHTNPHQGANVADAHPDIVARLLEETRKFRQAEIEKSKLYAKDGVESVEMDVEALQELQALGYGGDAQAGRPKTEPAPTP